jgi:predicted hotdog family 3-hydroxylacyl-ACP dehydratase
MSLAIESLLPHRAPMRWIDALLECTDNTASGTACFSPEHFAVRNGNVIESALVECMAQTVAAAMGQRARSQAARGANNPGMLAAIMNFKIHATAPIEKVLRIDVREIKRFGPMQLVFGTISCDGQVLADGELMLYA